MIKGAYMRYLKILFICHGNIYRSPMAEFLFRDYVRKKGLEDHFHIESAATSYEEIGNRVHHGTRRILDSLGIDCSEKRARRMTKADYLDYDYLIGMDEENIRNMYRFYDNDPDGKIIQFLDYSRHPRAIADPWYTGNFEETYQDIKEGCESFLEHLKKEGII